MGQKINPCIFRTGPTLNRGWGSVLYATGEKYGSSVIQDVKIRKIIYEKYSTAQIASVLIERPSNKSVTINIEARKPGVIIGKSGNDIEKLKQEIMKITSTEVYVHIYELKKPEIEANFIAQTLAQQLEKRQPFKRIMKRAVQAAMKQGAKGIKIKCSGRLGGVEIARDECYHEGRVPLHTLRADIGYATAKAITTFGVIGVKVWVYKGDFNKLRKRISKDYRK